MNAKQRNLLIVKYIFQLMVVLNIISSVWVIIYDRLAVNQAQEQFPDDWQTQERGEGYYAKYWFIACIVIMAINLLICLAGIFGSYRESSQIIMIYSALSFVVAVYGAWDKYMKGSITSYLVPLISGITGILYASLNYIMMFDGQQLPDASIKYVIKPKPVPTTPTVGTFEESEQLKQPDP